MFRVIAASAAVVGVLIGGVVVGWCCLVLLETHMRNGVICIAYDSV